jgi:DNA-binding transcriptional ArsR family regulator
MRRDVFQAIADPTRREIIGLISKRSLNLNSIANKFDISRPAISQHIKILMECGLVEIETIGRERYCSAKLDQLKEVHRWTEQFKTFWSKKLDALEKFLDDETNQLSRPKRRSSNKTIKKKEK